MLKACSGLSNFKTEVKCDKDLKETTTMSKSLFEILEIMIKQSQRKNTVQRLLTYVVQPRTLPIFTFIFQGKLKF